ncbi:tetratricopeptide repeat protein [Paenibacillus cremeus]|uniref:Tetratricopeptide repeat protein n=1 Tax=Paenibacillus cremeus TaxID=2163881 RepID=A0A559KHN8_9BACL|nr:tetratricopeptide repeat protein [Paenibacillus cremeus]TVY11642.1 tetratricopeptide repeat protein [Paenibacillus cremeus]
MDGEEAIRKAYESILKHDFEQAIAWFERAIALKPDRAEYHYKLSITYARSNKLEKAIVHAREAVKLDPRDEHYTFHYNHLQAKALLFQAEKLFEETDERLWLAVAFLKQAVELDPLSLEAFLLLSIAYARLQEFSLAIQAVKELLKLDPQHAIGNRLIEEYQLKWRQYMQKAFPSGTLSERVEIKDESDH